MILTDSGCFGVGVLRVFLDFLILRVKRDGRRLHREAVLF